jgi:hypothetical protein
MERIRNARLPQQTLTDKQNRQEKSSETESKVEEPNSSSRREQA